MCLMNIISPVFNFPRGAFFWWAVNYKCDKACLAEILEAVVYRGAHLCSHVPTHGAHVVKEAWLSCSSCRRGAGFNLFETWFVHWGRWSWGSEVGIFSGLNKGLEIPLTGVGGCGGDIHSSHSKTRSCLLLWFLGPEAHWHASWSFHQFLSPPNLSVT